MKQSGVHKVIGDNRYVLTRLIRKSHEHSRTPIPMITRLMDHEEREFLTNLYEAYYADEAKMEGWGR